MEDEEEVTVSSICFQKLDHKREEIGGWYLEEDIGLRKVVVIFKTRGT